MQSGLLPSRRSIGYPDSMGNWQGLGGVVASRRIAMVATMATVTILIADGCGPEQPPPPEVDGPPVVVAAGDIADCATEDDEATARLVEGIDGATVATLGDNAYPEGPAEDFEECYEPSWGQFKARTMPSPGNHEYETPGASAYFDYFGTAAGDPGEGYYSYTWEAGTSSPSTATAERERSAAVPAPPRGVGSKRTSTPTTKRCVPLPTSTTRCSLRGRIVPV